MPNHWNQSLAAFRGIPLLIFWMLLVPVFGLAQVRCQSDQSPKPKSNPRAQYGLEMLTPDEGVDFKHYLEDLFRKLKREWLDHIPPDVENGKRGIVRVEFRVQRDGSVAADSVKLTNSSGKDDFDAASLGSIKAAAPFANLPANFSQPFIQLRATFFYNVDPKGY
jgi:TonB family protein